MEAAIAAGGKLIFSGVGKSAHIAGKIAATFNSTGVSSCFLDPTQALHGDLGLCDEGDLAILLSNSGQSDEILRLVPILKRFGLKIVAFTGNPKSDLARGADHRLLYRVKREACPLKLAPTASTTAALALGDALAMVLLEARGLTRDDFAKYHPAGNLGRVLLLRARDIMRSGRPPAGREGHRHGPGGHPGDDQGEEREHRARPGGERKAHRHPHRRRLPPLRALGARTSSGGPSRTS